MVDGKRYAMVPGELYTPKCPCVLQEDGFNMRWDRKAKRVVTSGPKYFRIGMALDVSVGMPGVLMPGFLLVCVGAYHIDYVGGKRVPCYDMRDRNGNRFRVIPDSSNGISCIVPASLFAERNKS